MEAKSHFVIYHHLASFTRPDEVPGLLWPFEFWIPGVDERELEWYHEQESGATGQHGEKHSVWEVSGDTGDTGNTGES